MTTSGNRVLCAYKNGDWDITLYEDGTQVREASVPSPRLTWPTSIDVKITDKCSGDCAYCHEQSTATGKHGDLSFATKILYSLPAGAEVAIGGGNALAHPELYPFLATLRAFDIIPNITINHRHVPQYAGALRQMIKDRVVFGVGVSWDPQHPVDVSQFGKNTVIHMIIGVHSVEDFTSLLHTYPGAKVLLLGYKRYGKGVQFYSEEIVKRIQIWKQQIGTLLGQGTVSFDNLAVEQLAVRRFLTPENWEKFYMGDDGTFTFYIDMVKKEYARSSISPRYPIGTKNIRQMFSHIQSTNTHATRNRHPSR